MVDDSSTHRPWQFDHLGIVVGSLEKGRSVLSAMRGIVEWSCPIEDTVNGVRLQFGRDPAGLIYELLVPLNDTSPIHAALKQRKNILNHVAYRVDDLVLASRNMRASRSIAVAEPSPAIAYGNRLIQFYVTPFGMIVELIEAIDFQHTFQFNPIQSIHGTDQ